jgi:hypothetical protein
MWIELTGRVAYKLYSVLLHMFVEIPVAKEQLLSIQLVKSTEHMYETLSQQTTRILGDLVPSIWPMGTDNQASLHPVFHHANSAGHSLYLGLETGQVHQTVDCSSKEKFLTVSVWASYTASFQITRLL